MKFMKHGRRGKPHARTVTVNPANGRVDWGSGHLDLKKCIDICKGISK